MRCLSTAFYCAATLIVSLPCSYVLAAPPVEPKLSVPTRIYDKPVNLRKEDSRLEKHIQFSKPFVYLGELLEALSEQTGVTVTASDTDEAAGEEMTAVLPDLPLADVMDCLTSLFSHRGVRWQWRREGMGTAERPYVYRLLRPSNAITPYAEEMSKQIQEDFEKEGEIMVAGLDMSPEELKRKSKQYPRLDYLITGKTTPLGVRAFRDCLTPDQRLEVMRSRGKCLQIPLDKLPPSGQTLKSYMMNDFKQLNPGAEYHVESATFFTTDQGDNGIPRLIIGFGELGGWDYIGGKTLKDDTVARVNKDWLGEGEAKTNPDLEAQRLPKAKEVTPAPSDRSQIATPRRWAYVGETGKFPLLARLNRSDETTYGFEPWAKPLDAYLAEVGSDKGLLRKWRTLSDGKKALLLDTLGWYQADMDPEHPRVAWWVVKAIREEQAKNTNASAFEAMSLGGRFLSAMQLKHLERGELPVLQTLRLRLYNYNPLLAWKDEKPDLYKKLCSVEGVPLSEVPKGYDFVPYGLSEQGKRLRIVISDPTDTHTSWRIETLDANDVVVATQSFPTWKENEKKLQ